MNLLIFVNIFAIVLIVTGNYIKIACQVFHVERKTVIK